MAREKSYPEIPITVTFLPSPRARKIKKKTYKTKNIDEIIDGLENNTLPGIPAKAEIKHIGMGKCFM
ncbi:hypothetical protein OAA15_00640 [bacterium]|nr:hypothetical protein [bacterium]